MALRQDLEVAEVAMRFFETALREGRASVTPEMEREYDELQDELKRENPRGTRRIGFHAAPTVPERVAAD